jgi:hypothetical protein
VKLLGSPLDSDGVSLKSVDARLAAFKIRANQASPIITDWHGPSTSLGFSSGGANLTVAPAATGRVVCVRGSVIDVAFSGERRPHPCIEHADGLARGVAVTRTGQGLHVPVGPPTLGRVFNVLGEPLDDLPPPLAADRWPIHHLAASFDAERRIPTFVETGIKVIDLLGHLPYPGSQGGGSAFESIAVLACPSPHRAKLTMQAAASSAEEPITTRIRRRTTNE